MIAYKAMRRREGKLLSATTIYKFLEYKENETIYPEFGYIFVFADLEKAIKFTDYLDYEIWSVEVPDLFEGKYMADFADEGNYERFWGLSRSKRKSVGMPTPEGTYFTSSVTLIECVHKGEIG